MTTAAAEVVSSTRVRRAYRTVGSDEDGRWEIRPHVAASGVVGQQMSASRDAVARGRHDSDVAVRRGARRSCVRPSSKSPGRAAARVRPRPDGRTSITPNHDLNNFEKKRGKRMNRNRATEQDGRDRRHRRRVGSPLCSSDIAGHIWDTLVHAFVCGTQLAPTTVARPVFRIISR